MINADTNINDIQVNALTTGKVMFIEGGSSKANPAKVKDMTKTLGDSIITNHTARVGFRNVPIVQSAECQGHELWNFV